jgi:tagatose 6-phosphate kinase
MHLVVSLSPCLDEVFVVDELRAGSVLAGIDPVAHAGGKGSNVARGLRSLGKPVTLFTALGGATGERIAALLARDRIDTVAVPAAGDSRRCVIVVERRCGRQTVLNGSAPPVPARSIARLLGRLERALAGRPRAVVLTGSLPRECPADVSARIVAMAIRAGVPLLVDSSGAGLRAALAGAQPPPILKVNRRELRSLFDARPADAGREPSLRATLGAARRTRERFGVGEVVVTGGSEEAVAVASGECLVARPPRVRPLNAVGSGDAFAAGFVAAPGAPLVERLSLALAAGSANAEDLEPCRLDRSRVSALRARVAIARG